MKLDWCEFHGSGPVVNNNLNNYFAVVNKLILKPKTYQIYLRHYRNPTSNQPNTFKAGHTLQDSEQDIGAFFLLDLSSKKHLESAWSDVLFNDGRRHALWDFLPSSSLFFTTCSVKSAIKWRAVQQVYTFWLYTIHVYNQMKSQGTWQIGSNTEYGIQQKLIVNI